MIFNFSSRYLHSIFKAKTMLFQCSNASITRLQTHTHKKATTKTTKFPRAVVNALLFLTSQCKVFRLFTGCNQMHCNGRLPLPHSQASSLFIGSKSSAKDTNQMALWNRLAPRTVGPGWQGPVSVQLTLALAESV